MKQTIWIVSLLLLAAIIVPASLAAQEQPLPPPDYRQLPDLPIFTDEPFGQWAGSGMGLELETIAGPALPVDEAEMYNDLPSYRVRATGENGWWSFILAGPNWEAYSISPYFPDGALEFNVKGAEGWEDFQIALNDVVNGREPQNISSNAVTVSDFISVTPEWQRVRIPLSALLSSTAGFNTDQMFSISFSSVSGDPLTFWLNDIRFTTSGQEPGYPAIKLNQLGYLPNAPKIARVSGFPEELTAAAGTPFEVRDLRTSEIAYTGELQLLDDFDAVVSGERVLAADFSDLSLPGDYYLTVNAYQVEDSPPFKVADDLYNQLLIDSLRYFYLQRSGIELEAQHAGRFARGAGHLQDAAAEFRSGNLPPRDVSGGWYDAGDYGKYTNAGATAVSDLLWTYELFPELFGDGQLNIPESGNGQPDLLDEVRWELDWILKMQDPDSGGFYHMVQPSEDLVIPEALEPRFIEDVNEGESSVRPTSTSGSAVGALAHAAIIYEPFDAAYAAELLAAAEAGWGYLQAQSDTIPPMPGPYSDQEDADDRFYAAAVLYRATGEEAYQAYLLENYGQIDSFFESPDDNGYGVGLMEMIAWLHIAHSAEADPELSAHFESIFTPWTERMIGRWQDSPWRIALLDEDFYWGSNYVTLTTPLVMLVGADALGEGGTLDPTAATIGLEALDYLLGANPLRFSYVSGYGVDRFSNPHSAQWNWDGIAEVPSGILAGGPNAYTNPLFFSNFAAKRYVDSTNSWTVNEHTIYWNSALVFHAALAAHLGGQDAITIAAPPVQPMVESTAAEAGDPALVDPPQPQTPSNSGDLAALQEEVDTLTAEFEALRTASAQGTANETPANWSMTTVLIAVVIGWLAVLSAALVFVWRRKG